MIKFTKLVIMVLIFLMLTPYNSYGHPGGQNPDGGHVCRTNCDEWGLEYGEYHYHNYINRPGTGTSNIKSNENSITIPSWLIILVVVIIGFLYFAFKNRNTDSYRPRKIIDDSPTLQVPPPILLEPVVNDIEVDMCGIIKATRYRKNNFFVCTFYDETNNGSYTIVGIYTGRIYKGSRCRITGILTYHARYGKQINVKSLERL